MFKTGLAATAALCAAMPAMADVCQLTSREVAFKAVSMLNGVDRLMVYCEPCGKHVAIPIGVKKALVIASDDPAYYQVQIDGAGVDLAFLYYRPAGAQKWVNVGLAAGCPDASGVVPSDLPDDLASSAGR
jgi:hypothetical protein